MRTLGIIRKGVAAVALVMIGGQAIGCASLMNQSNGSGYNIATTPPGAKVTVDGRHWGTTPVVLPLDVFHDHFVRLEREGCPTFDVMVSSRVRPWVFGNLLFGGLIGLLIDASTGAMYELEPDVITLAYEEQGRACTVMNLSPLYATARVVPPQPAGEEVYGYRDNRAP